jgi:hypothetical protein
MNKKAASGNHTKNMNSIASAAKMMSDEAIDEKLEEGNDDGSDSNNILDDSKP